MGTFRDFLEQEEQLNSLVNEFNTNMPAGNVPAFQTKTKVWSAKKPEILQMWKNLRGDTPVFISPIADLPGKTDHSNYAEDGLRITGSWNFIASVLARLKELMAYENPQTKLRLIFRGIDPARTMDSNKRSYVFYLNLERRTHGQAGRPQENPTTLKPPTIG